ncbi:hypothetical protein [Novilysobacter arseniciresistens]|uniref:hypothetical protein n=1 Tax=Novilysobacter arseniciresistens TaxID=1385522 RepID=UPI00126A1A77|nr:hypothetical protein [Lysobacter arseniciresistens]
MNNRNAWGLLLASGLAVACAPVTAPEAPQVVVERVDAPRYSGSSSDPLESACNGWRLSPAQVKEFFRHSSAFDAPPLGEFYQVPCSISGALRVDGERWEFVIDGGATATWRNDKRARYWGCKARRCEALVLLPYDGMSSGW